MPTSMAAALIRPQPHFLAAGIAAMAAAAMQANNVTSTPTSANLLSNRPLVTTATSNGPSWPPGPPGPPLGFPLGLPGLRHPLFSTGNQFISFLDHFGSIFVPFFSIYKLDACSLIKLPELFCKIGKKSDSNLEFFWNHRLQIDLFLAILVRKEVSVTFNETYDPELGERRIYTH